MGLQEYLKTKLESRIYKDAQSGCWLWLGGAMENGYGVIYGGKEAPRNFLVHRVSLFVYQDISLDTPLDASHKCHNRICCNPEHLKYIAHVENIQERVWAGRTRNQYSGKIRCRNGHSFDGIDYRGNRYCKTCVSERKRRQRFIQSSD